MCADFIEVILITWLSKPTRSAAEIIVKSFDAFSKGSTLEAKRRVFPSRYRHKSLGKLFGELE